jgi:hypothetical protein
LNPLLRGWGEYYKRAHVRKLFNQLDRWIVRRIWSHRFRRWRNCGWKQLPESKLYGEFGLVNLIGLIPSIASSEALSLRESLHAGKPHARFERRTEASAQARLLRPDRPSSQSSAGNMSWRTSSGTNRMHMRMDIFLVAA